MYIYIVGPEGAVTDDFAEADLFVSFLVEPVHHRIVLDSF